MKFVRVLSRIIVLLVAAAGFAGLTAMYGGSAPPPTNPRLWAWREHRPSAPDLGRFPELIGEGIVVAIYAAAGRLIFRLRLSPRSRSKGAPISLGLHGDQTV